MERHGKLQAFKILAHAFIRGDVTNSNFVHELESQFLSCVDPETCDEFRDLEEALSMYGASTSEHDCVMLSRSLKRALPQIETQLDACLQ